MLVQDHPGCEAALTPPRPAAPPGPTAGPWAQAASHRILYTTGRCPHQCLFCLDEAFPDCAEPTGDDLRRKLDAAAAAGFPSVTFMSREPLSRPDVVSLIAYGTGLGLEVVVSTNGLRFADASLLQRCVDAGLRSIEMSFHYPDADTYATLTRTPPRGFARLLHALDNVDAYNAAHPDAPLKVHVNTVLNGLNVHRLAEVMGHLDERLRHTPTGVSLKAMSIPPGRADVLREAGALVSYGTLREALTGFFAARQDGSVVVRLGTLPYCVAPGFEHLSSHLTFVWRQLAIEWDLSERRRMEDVIAHRDDDAFPQEPLLLQVCAACTLDALCGYRSIFPDVKRGREFGPVPSRRDPVDVLVASGATREQADAALAAARRSAVARPPVRPALDPEGAGGPAPADLAAAPPAPDGEPEEAVRRIAHLLDEAFGRPPGAGAVLPGGFAVDLVRLSRHEVEVELRPVAAPPEGGAPAVGAAPPSSGAAAVQAEAGPLVLLLEPSRSPDQRCFARAGDVCVSYRGPSVGRGSPRLRALMDVVQRLAACL